MSREEQIKELEKDKRFAKAALRMYLQHFLIPSRANIIEDLVVELANEGTIIADWIEIY